ncbi:MAG: DUF1653 domain-containing protein [Longicatena sp.]
MKNWINKAVFYHIYPLGLCGAPRFHEETITHSITKVLDWIPHLKQMQINALYLGPVFESYEHGYDTSDYRMLDRRLGDNEDFKRVCDALHEEGIHIVLDGVFNHVGREFFAFKDILKNRENSKYLNWFVNVRFDQNNPYNDGFNYDTWQGYHNLIKLNLKNEEVVQYLLESVGMWMDDFHVNGLRLDAADCIDLEFFHRLKGYCKGKDESFWLMGEIIHGDYTVWANNDTLDSVTNYECYKGLYSSHNDKNYFEIGHSLNRQFAKGGIYEHLHLYNFVDNHDVNRLASTLKDKIDLVNVYALLYTMPGIPSVYYGSEWAMEGKKHDGSDADIRPSIEIEKMKDIPLTKHIAKLGSIRQQYPVLFDGAYESISLKNVQFVFKRYNEEMSLTIVLNVADTDCEVDIASQGMDLFDVLEDTSYPCIKDNVRICVKAKSSCILIEKQSVTPPKTLIQKEDKKTLIVEKPLQKPLVVEINEDLPLGRYEHFKGKHYAVLYVGYHSETLEKYVVYRQLYGEGSVWVRPLSMFKENVEVDGKQVPRFRYIKE